jgi:transposase
VESIRRWWRHRGRGDHPDATRLLITADAGGSTEIARELGVSPEGLRGWVKQDSTDRGEGLAGALTTDEREELRRVRRELAEVKKANEILVKAAAFFAKEIVK